MGYKEGDKVIHFTKKNFLDMGKILALACNKF